MTILKLCISLAAVFFFQIHHFLLSSAIFVHKFQAKQHTLCHLLIHSVWFCENFRWKISRLSNLYHNNLYPRRPHKFTSLPTLIIILATYRVFFSLMIIDYSKYRKNDCLCYLFVGNLRWAFHKLPDFIKQLSCLLPDETSSDHHIMMGSL